MDDEPQSVLGRPTKFTDHMRAEILRLACLGLTDKQLCAVLHITEQSLTNWKRESPEFFASLKTSKKGANKNVKASLYARACGYSHEAVKIFCKDGVITKANYIEHYPPDPTAAIFWLKNREPEKWRDKHDFDLGPETSTLIERLTKALERTG